MESLSDKNLAQLMNNRPLVYTKRVNKESVLDKPSSKTIRNGSTTQEEKKEIILKYSDKSRYSAENVFGRVYVDSERIKESQKSGQESLNYKRELKAARLLSAYLDADIFLLPPNENGQALYVERGSNPDAIVYGIFIDLKSNGSGKESSIKSHFGRATKQADAMYLTLEGNTSISEAKRILNGKANSIKDRNIDGFQVLVSDKNGNFSEYIVRKKRLVESPFSGEAGLSPSFNLNIKDNNSNVKKTGDTSKSYTKNIDYTYAQGSLLVPYTTEQIIGRIRQGMPVEASHLQTLLDSNKDNAEFNKRYRSVIQKELSAIRILTANPVLNRTILEEYSKMDSSKGINKNTLYDNVLAKMKEIDSSFTFFPFDISCVEKLQTEGNRLHTSKNQIQKVFSV